jgi:hypothetical protein
VRHGLSLRLVLRQGPPRRQRRGRLRRHRQLALVRERLSQRGDEGCGFFEREMGILAAVVSF